MLRHPHWGDPAARERASGWLTFASVLLSFAGLFYVIIGLVALLRAGYLSGGADRALAFGATGWGWTWLVLGALQLATAVGVQLGTRWGRVVALALAMLAALGHAAFLGAFPLWSAFAIALCVLVIYAVVVPAPSAVGT